MKSFAEVMQKFNPHHDPKTGRFASRGGGARGGSGATGSGRGSHATPTPPSREPAGPGKVQGALTPFDTAAVVRARALMHTYENTSTIMRTPERMAFQNIVVDELYGSGASKKERRIDIVMGGPAVGKTSAIGAKILEQRGAIEIDSDLAKAKLPEFRGGANANGVHEESVTINARVLEKAMRNGDNIMLPVVGKTESGLLETIDSFKKAGYAVHLHHVALPVEEATRRVISRFEHTGRFVDTNYVYNVVGEKPRGVYENVKRNANLSSSHSYDNDVPKGTAARVTDSWGDYEANGLGNRRRGGNVRRRRASDSGRAMKSFSEVIKGEYQDNAQALGDQAHEATAAASEEAATPRQHHDAARLHDAASQAYQIAGNAAKANEHKKYADFHRGRMVPPPPAPEGKEGLKPGGAKAKEKPKAKSFDELRSYLTSTT